ncbi:MAG: 3-hydroxyacyl-ACP dehydratase FabZ [Magnetovibrio sp.]|nr:3-hydroxyacyl-ACP dehydratase FabZ [Magnetovibrio sp.]
MEMIPHRYPFLMIDRVKDIVKGKSAVGIKNVTASEPHFQGHFPDHPIMPGVLIVEAMAQTSAVLVVDTLGEESEGKLVYFMSVENARFRRPVVPGHTLEITVTQIQSRRNIFKFKGVAVADGNVMAEAVFSAMIMDR